MTAVNARKPATNRPANRAARRATSPRRPALRPVGAILRDVARVACAEGQRLGDDGPRYTIAETMLSFTAGSVTWRQILDTGIACCALGELVTFGGECTGEGGSHRVYPLAWGRAYARLGAELFDHVAERFDIPDGREPADPAVDGLALVDLDAAGDVDLGAEVSR